MEKLTYEQFMSFNPNDWKYEVIGIFAGYRNVNQFSKLFNETMFYTDYVRTCLDYAKFKRDYNMFKNFQSKHLPKTKYSDDVIIKFLKNMYFPT